MSEELPFAGLADALDRALDARLNQPATRAAIVSDWMTVAEACAYLKFSERALRHMITRRQIPFYQPTQKGIRLSRAELDDWVRSGCVDPDA